MSADAAIAALVKGLNKYCPPDCRESDSRCFSMIPEAHCGGIPARDAIFEAEKVLGRKLDGKMHEESPIA